jgi:hypothetical protein
MEIVKFKGHEIELAGVKYQCPPLSPYAYAKYGASKKIQTIREEIDKMQKGNQNFAELSEESFTNIIELTTLALKRNYPDITEDDVGEGFYDGFAIFGVLQFLISQDEKVQEEMQKQIKNVQKQSGKTTN